MKKYLILSFFLISTLCIAQQPNITFEYDSAGNQILRQWCSSCVLVVPLEDNKEITDLKDEDLQKFFPEDVISYYPNPVKEQLYLKWELIDNNKVSAINIYSINGQLIKSYNNLEGKNNCVINFKELPQDLYSLVLVYTNGENKSIKIVKE